MKKSTRPKKLYLHRETITTLTDYDLHLITAQADGYTGFSSCMAPNECPREITIP